jgi:hypothetical protein
MEHPHTGLCTLGWWHDCSAWHGCLAAYAIHCFQQLHTSASSVFHGVNTPPTSVDSCATGKRRNSTQAGYQAPRMPEGPTEEMLMACFFFFHLPENLQQVQGEAAGMAWHSYRHESKPRQVCRPQSFCSVPLIVIYFIPYLPRRLLTTAVFVKLQCMCSVQRGPHVSWRQCGVTFLMQILSISGLFQEPTSWVCVCQAENAFDPSR